MPGWFLMIKPQIEFWLAGFDRLTRRAISRKRCPDLSSGDKTLNEKFLRRKIATTCRVQCVFFSWTAYFSFLRPKKKSLKLLLGYFRSFSECADTKQFLIGRLLLSYYLTPWETRGTLGKSWDGTQGLYHCKQPIKPQYHGSSGKKQRWINLAANL